MFCFCLCKEEGCPFNPHDLKTLLHHSGLESKLELDWLETTHSCVQEVVPRGQKVMVGDLLEVAVTLSQLSRLGLTRQEAVKHAVEDVYVSRRSSIKDKQVRYCSVSFLYI